tara:strand:- start:3236 stop:3484 length:249 start_codon:yes stop_codon:yes gene_type:complete
MGKEINLNPAQQQNININPKDLEDMLCSKCNCQTFEPVFLFKKLSAVLSPSGKDTIIPLQVYKCTECAHIDEGFLPKDAPSE